MRLSHMLFFSLFHDTPLDAAAFDFLQSFYAKAYAASFTF
jgi:hypothetical protein